MKSISHSGNQTGCYYAFGMLMPGRQYSGASGYRYGFNGMEKDDEMKGSGNSYTTEFRLLDSRIGRWMSIDPKAENYPEQSPYVAFDNNPIYYTDPRGSQTEPLLNSADKFKKVKFADDLQDIENRVSALGLALNPGTKTKPSVQIFIPLSQATPPLKPTTAIDNLKAAADKDQLALDCATWTALVQLEAIRALVGNDNQFNNLFYKAPTISQGVGQDPIPAHYSFGFGSKGTQNIPSEGPKQDFENTSASQNDAKTALSQAPIGSIITLGATIPANAAQNYGSENIIKVGANSYFAFPYSTGNGSGKPIAYTLEEIQQKLKADTQDADPASGDTGSTDYYVKGITKFDLKKIADTIKKEQSTEAKTK